MDIIGKLPVELQNTTFYYYAEHPCSLIIKDDQTKLFDIRYREYLSYRDEDDEDEFDFNFYQEDRYSNLIGTCDFCNKKRMV